MSLRIAAAILLAATVTAVATLTPSKAVAATGTKCKTVRGHITSQTATENCTSPLGLCASGQFYGAVRGDFFLVATSLTPTQDTPVTGVFTYTGDNVIKTRDGEIYMKDVGALNLTPGGNGDDVSLSIITGGTGKYAGATGSLRAVGTFSEAGGEFSYEGDICTP